MALIKFLITALAATLMFTSSVLANPVPALTAAATTPDTTPNHLEKRVCNEHGCGLKCKKTPGVPCSMNLTGFQDCTICTYFEYKADGSAVMHWDVECLFIQWGKIPQQSRC
ncbi:hypothetical protein VE00_01270 [Pseudogymnoascus sp. WSF 3629]|nr:hypothetical protein VE00_01270 [Pseudogymnoascus sp. WSF 3629]